MSLDRRKALTIMAASAVTIGMAGLPANAENSPEVAFAGSVSGDLGRLRMWLRATSPITQIRAHLRSLADGAEFAVVDDFFQFEGTDIEGEWRSSQLLQLPALGWYRVDVEVWSEGGGYVHASKPGDSSRVMQYWSMTELENFAFTPEKATPDHRMVTASGRLMAKHPGTLALTAAVGGKVIIHVGDQRGRETGYTTEAVADAEGRFAVNLPIEFAAYVLVLPEGDGYTYRETGQQFLRHVEIDPTPTRLALELSRTPIERGESTHLSGHLEILADGQWAPLVGKYVHLGIEGFSSSWLPTPVVTDTQGRFSVLVSPPGSTTVIASFADHQFVATSTASIGVTVLALTEFDDYFTVRHSLDPRKPTIWVVKGILRDGPYAATVHIQAATSTTGPWTNLKSVPVQWGEVNAEIQVFDPCYIRAFAPATAQTRAAASKAIPIVGSAQPRRGESSGSTPTPRRR